MYKTKAEFENEVCSCLRRDHQLLSNLVHPLPLSIERINNENGRGVGSVADINYSIMSLIIARKYLAATTIEITDHFDEHFGGKFKESLDSIRLLVSSSA